MIWYAILRDNEDNDWGTGSFNREEAIEMAKKADYKLLATIENDVCVKIEEVAECKEK